MSEMTPERIARALASAVVLGDELARDEPESDAQEPRDDGDDPGGGRSPEFAE